MQAEAIRNLTDEEIKAQEAQSGEQLFRLRFAQGLGQNDGVRRVRDLRKDIARLKTIARQRALGLATAPAESAAPAKKSRAKKG